MNCSLLGGILPLVTPDDYGTISTILQFPPCETRQCIDMQIQNDCHVEEDEFFTTVLGVVSHGDFVNVSKSPLIIYIKDNDCKSLKHSLEGNYYIKWYCRSQCAV